MPPTKIPNFFVYIIEFPTAEDLYYERQEAHLLRQAVSLNELPSAHRLTLTKDLFLRAVGPDFDEVVSGSPSRCVALHLSGHGNEDGIGFADGGALSWWDLRELFKRMNRKISETKGRLLLVCMSSCYGYAGVRMAMTMDEHDTDLPFHALVGCSTKPFYSHTAVAYASLYHQLALGTHIRDAVAAMRAASGIQEFAIEWGEVTRQEFLEYARTHRAAETMTTMSGDSILPQSSVLDYELVPTPSAPIEPAPVQPTGPSIIGATDSDDSER